MGMSRGFMRLELSQNCVSYGYHTLFGMSELSTRK